MKLNLRTTRPASYCSTLIDLFATDQSGVDQKVGFGTGFFVEAGTRTALVTNWHVLTGRNPDDPSRMVPGFRAEPDKLQLHLPTLGNRGHFRPGELIPLYDDGRPIWIQPPSKLQADVAVIPLDLPPDAHAPHIQQFAPTGSTVVEPGKDVVIIGFPFPRNDTNPFPVWKRAMIASEPAYTFSGKPQMLVDTPGRPGMSGSPVYLAGPGFPVTDEQKKELEAGNARALNDLRPEQLSDTTTALEFIGVYSGSYGDRDYDQIHLGRVWSAAVLKMLLDDPQSGTNPFRS